MLSSAPSQPSNVAGSHAIQMRTHGDGTFTSHLTVSGVAETDSGLYVCVVIGRHGGRSFRSAFLTVVGTRLGGLPTDNNGQSSAEPSASSSDAGLVPIIAALAAVAAILIVAVVGFVVHRRRSSKSTSSPSSSGGSVGATAAVTSSLLASSGGASVQHPRRGYDQAPSGLVVHHRQHLVQHQHPHPPQLYAEPIERYQPPLTGGIGSAGLGMSTVRTAGSAGSGSAGNGPSMTSAAAATGRDRFGVRHPADSTSYSDYSSISRTVGGVASSPHLYALQQQQQQSPHLYQHPLYQMQGTPTVNAVGAGTQLHYYEGC